MAHFQVRKLFLLVASWNILMPRVSSLADEVSVVFQGIDNATTLLLSDDGATLYVGARDEVLSLDVSQPGVMTVKRKTVWPPGPENINQCTERGKNEKVDCPNYIRVLQFLNGTHLYACGSHAFKPHSRLFDRETLEFLGSPKEVRGHCPFNPLKRSAAITVDGELYTATTSDYLEKKPSISRYLSKGRNDMTLDSHMSVLEEPTFIKSFFVPSERKVYFFFSEVGKEYTFTEKLTVSRVAQVCTDDVGGEYMLQKRWTTFAKAPLVCQPQRQLPFTVMQDIVALPPPENERADNTLFYGVFSSQWPSAAAASVVCAFQLSDVNAVFSGNYKTYKTETNQWLPQTDKALNIGKCGLLHENGKKLEYVRKTFLTDGKVQAVNRRLALVSADEDYCRIAVQRTKAANGRAYTVLFLLTESGFLHKAVLLGTGHRIIDKTQVFTPPQVMKSLLLSTAKGVVFVGSSEGVTQVPVSLLLQLLYLPGVRFETRPLLCLGHVSWDLCQCVHDCL
uniref:Sema domain-containing protein n=1 Tax=Denticeps clupeoides TaxID=299321 RepID=A0AAY4D9K9_9TELE